MYKLASFFFSKKTINSYLKLEIHVVCREFVAFKYVVIVFFKTKPMIISIFTSEILKTVLLFICICVDREKSILCCRKIGVKMRV